jgi:cytochrome bd-type quinol oxidase subunit 2
MELILNTTLIGLTALLVITMQGSLWIAMNNRGGVESRALSIASMSHWGVCAFVLGTFAVSLNTHTGVASALSTHPLLWIIPVTATAGLFVVRECLWMKLSGPAFVSSAIFVIGLFGSGAFGLAR